MSLPLVAKFVTGGVAASSVSFALAHRNQVHAESSQPFTRPETVEQHRSKLSLYDSQTEPVTLLPHKSPLQDEVAQARAVFQDATKGMKSSTDEGKATWMRWERQAEGSLQRIVSPQDQLNPGAMYVAVAALAGSIVARNRNILVRAALPPTFLLLSLDYFLPNTAANLWSKAKGVESAHFPQVKEARQKISAALGK